MNGKGGVKTMCGRYYLKSDDMSHVVATLLNSLAFKAGDNGKTQGDIYPGDTAPVLSHNRRGDIRAFFMDWGFHADKKRIFNARAETAAARPLFRDSMQNRRCLIPASLYYEWDTAHHVKHDFFPEVGKGLLLAGLYRQEQDGRYSYTVLTRDAAPHLAPLHPRMPVILPADALPQWLSPACDPMTILLNARTDIACRLSGQVPLDKIKPDLLY